MDDGADAPTLIRDMQTRVALLFDAWAIAMVREGRREEFRDILAARVDAANAEWMVERIVALAEAPAPPQTPEPGARPKRDASPGQGSLF